MFMPAAATVRHLSDSRRRIKSESLFALLALASLRERETLLMAVASQGRKFPRLSSLSFSFCAVHRVARTMQSLLTAF